MRSYCLVGTEFGLGEEKALEGNGGEHANVFTATELHILTHFRW